MASETAPEFDARTTARHLLRTAFQAALGTLDPDSGAPHVSLVTLATLPDGAPVLLLSDLAVHTRNVKADARVSLMVSEPVRPGDPLALARVTVAGRIARTDDPVARRRFLARHPEAAAYAAFPHFGVSPIPPQPPPRAYCHLRSSSALPLSAASAASAPVGRHGTRQATASSSCVV